MRDLFVESGEIKFVLYIILVNLRERGGKERGEGEGDEVGGNSCQTSQKNSFPRREQNQEIHETSSELLMSSKLFSSLK